MINLLNDASGGAVAGDYPYPGLPRGTDTDDFINTSKTTITDEGWFVEVRIPFSTIGFQVGADGRAVMGLTVTRLVSRLGFVYQYFDSREQPEPEKE